MFFGVFANYYLKSTYYKNIIKNYDLTPEDEFKILEYTKNVRLHYIKYILAG